MTLERVSPGCVRVTMTKPDLSSAAIGTGLPIDLGGNGFSGPDLAVDAAATGGLSAALFGALYAGIELAPALRAGTISKKHYFKTILKAAGHTAKRAAPALVITGAALALVPALLPVATVAGIGALGFSGYRLAQLVRTTLTTEQMDILRKAAADNQVTLEILEPWYDAELPEDPTAQGAAA